MMMNEKFDIDNLKTFWKKQESNKIYSQEELVLMLSKKSSNNIKYIVWISVIEFIVVMISLFFSTGSLDNLVLKNLSKVAQQDYIEKYEWVQKINIINLFISLFFIVMFYRIYKSIRIENSTKNFIFTIVKFRKWVNIFIVINIIIGIINMYLTGFYDFIAGFKVGYKSQSSEINQLYPWETDPFHSTTGIIIFIVFLIFMLLIVFTYYQLVYGILMRRLKRNIKELKKIKEETK